MIRTLVVDDDFQVARIHAASVERVDGFTCIGQANTADQARAAIAADHPDLLVLDIYLPDTDGLTLLRELTAQGRAPDTIFITAARDIDSVRSAMSLGAIYYLVKPFGFAQLREQLQAYRVWRDQLASGISTPADQETVDSLFNVLRPRSIGTNPQASLPTTMAKVFQAILDAPQPIGASQVAQALGMSRPTAQRYLSDLERRRMITLELSYGATGRPVHRYRSALP